jgi:hypothetical protein
MKPNAIIFAFCALFAAATSLLQPARAEFDPAKNILPEAALKILENADIFVLLSLDPVPKQLRQDAQKIQDTFHNHPVLGRTTITNKTERSDLLNAFLKGVRDSDGSVARCFNPRHGISAKRGSQTVDLVICFECLSTDVYLNGQPTNGVATTAAPQPTFDKALDKARIPKEPRRAPTPDPGFE